MIDYLERAAEGSADALLEQMLLSGGWSQPGAASMDRTPEGQKGQPSLAENAPERLGEQLAQREPLRAAVSAAERLSQRLEEVAPFLQAAPEAEQPLPLQKQTVLVDRILTAARQLPAEWSGASLHRREHFSATSGMSRERGWPSGLPVEGEKQRLPALLPGEAGGEQDWARQVDRVFRRDSRRYDNGFFLY